MDKTAIRRGSMDASKLKEQSATKPCTTCFTPIPVPARKCTTCQSTQFPERRCVICAEAIPEEARRCKHCQSYQGWLRRRFTFSHTMLSLLSAVFAVIGSLFVAATWVGDRHSHTEFKVLGANTDVLYVQVSNTGRKASALLGGRLTFLQLPLQPAKLRLAAESNGEVTSIVIPGGTTRAGLTVSRIHTPLRIHPATKAGIAQLLEDDVDEERMLELELDVEESGRLWDFTTRPYVVKRYERFPAKRIQEFIMGRMVDIVEQ